MIFAARMLWKRPGSPSTERWCPLSKQASPGAAASLSAVSALFVNLSNGMMRTCHRACPQVQQIIGAKKAVAFDLTAACSGFVVGLVTAAQYVRTGAASTVLVIGADALSRYIDWRDRGKSPAGFSFFSGLLSPPCSPPLEPADGGLAVASTPGCGFAPWESVHAGCMALPGSGGDVLHCLNVSGAVGAHGELMISELVWDRGGGR